MFKNQLEDSPPEYQDMRTNTSSATDIQTDNVEDNKEVHISQLSQLVSELVDGDNLSEFLLELPLTLRKKKILFLKLPKEFGMNLQKAMDTNESEFNPILF